MGLRLKQQWPQFRQSRDPVALRVLWAMATTLVLLSVYLVSGPNPWENSITKRLASGKPLKLEQLITLGLWWGALTAWLAALFALATVKWWSRPQTAVYPDLQPPTTRAVRWTWAFALAAMALAVWPRLARIDHSLWNDEEYHLRTYVWGTAKPDGADRLQFDAITWPEAVFGNEKGNNHLWSSIEVRLGHALTGHHWEQGSTFSERGLRTFPFLSGILTVGLMVWLGAALGGPRAGLAAGLLLALHPWHVRWSVEIRGYSTMLMAVTAGLLCLVNALQTNRWRWWCGYAVAQALFLLCFAGSLYVAAAQNIVALAVILSSGSPASVRKGGASRLVLAGIFSLIPVALFYGPHVPQIAAYLKTSNEYAPIGIGWFADLWSHLVSGLRPAGDAPGTSQGIGLPDLTSVPWKMWMVFGLFPVFCVLGLALMLWKDWRTRLVAGTLLLAGILAIGHNALSGSPFLTWYVLYLIPLFILSLVWGTLALIRWQPKALASLPLVLVVGFILVTAPALERIMHIPRQPIRETVAAMRGVAPALQENPPGILTASFGDGARQMLSYDPRLRLLKTPAELESLIAEATTRAQPLYLCLRGPATTATEHPSLFKALTSDPRWQLLPPVLGMEAMLSYDIYRFAPEAAGRIQLNP